MWTIDDMENNRSPNYFATRFLAGAMSGVSFWLWALQIDSIKTNIEAQSLISNDLSIKTSNPIVLSWETSKQLIQRGGFMSLYKSRPVAIGRGIPAAAVTLTSYDIIFDLLK